jgi:hypothetical protein
MGGRRSEGSAGSAYRCQIVENVASLLPKDLKLTVSVFKPKLSWQARRTAVTATCSSVAYASKDIQYGEEKAATLEQSEEVHHQIKVP